MKIYSIIPARGGSKGVPKKNIRLLGGYPLIAFSITAAKMTKSIDRVVVSTESSEIAKIAKRYGAEIPFFRPVELAGDKSTELEFQLHFINWLKQNEKHIPDLIVQLLPTTPLRDPRKIEDAIKIMKKAQEGTSLRSAHELAEPPQKMFQINKKGFFEGFFPDDPRPDYFNLPRQTFPKAYHPNGYVDIMRPKFILKNNRVHGSKILAFITEHVTEIDRSEDFEYLEYQIKKSDNPVYGYLKNHFKKEK
ncbi:MAG TPA: acylneuraminate cytidylyltransferase family protein [Candidatus Paceibacterota bacterium]